MALRTTVPNKCKDSLLASFPCRKIMQDHLCSEPEFRILSDYWSYSIFLPIEGSPSSFYTHSSAAFRTFLCLSQDSQHAHTECSVITLNTVCLCSVYCKDLAAYYPVAPRRGCDLYQVWFLMLAQ